MQLAPFKQGDELQLPMSFIPQATIEIYETFLKNQKKKEKKKLFYKWNNKRRCIRRGSCNRAGHSIW